MLLISFFRRNDSVLMIWVPATVLLGTLLKTAINPESPEFTFSPFFGFLTSAFDSTFGIWVNAILSAILAMIMFIMMNRLIQSLGMMTKLSNIPLLVMTVFYFLMPGTLNSPVLWVVMIFEILFLKYCAAIISEEKSAVDVINAAFIAGLLTITYPFLGINSLALLGILMLSGHFDFRFFLLTLIGMWLPFYFVFGITYLFVPESLNLWDVHFFHFQFFTPQMLIALGILILTTFSAIANNLKILSSVTLREKRKWQLQLILFVTSIGALPLAGASGFITASMVPATIILSRTLTSHPVKWLAESFFVGLLILVVINSWF